MDFLRRIEEVRARVESGDPDAVPTPVDTGTGLAADALGERALAERAPFVDARLSPDGRTVAIARQATNQDIWLYALESGGHGTRLTTQAGADMAPIWNATGTHLTFTADRLLVRPQRVALCPGAGVRQQPPARARRVWR